MRRMEPCLMPAPRGRKVTPSRKRASRSVKDSRRGCPRRPTAARDMHAHLFQGRKERIRLHGQDHVQRLGEIGMTLRRGSDQPTTAIPDPEPASMIRSDEIGLQRRSVRGPEQPEGRFHVEAFTLGDGVGLAGENEQPAFFRFRGEHQSGVITTLPSRHPFTLRWREWAGWYAGPALSSHHRRHSTGGADNDRTLSRNAFALSRSPRASWASARLSQVLAESGNRMVFNSKTRSAASTPRFPRTL